MARIGRPGLTDRADLPIACFDTRPALLHVIQIGGTIEGLSSDLAQLGRGRVDYTLRHLREYLREHAASTGL
jgi:hypothetical protein